MNKKKFMNNLSLSIAAALLFTSFMPLPEADAGGQCSKGGICNSSSKDEALMGSGEAPVSRRAKPKHTLSEASTSRGAGGLLVSRPSSSEHSDLSDPSSSESGESKERSPRSGASLSFSAPTTKTLAPEPAPRNEYTDEHFHDENGVLKKVIIRKDGKTKNELYYDPSGKQTRNVEHVGDYMYDSIQHSNGTSSFNTIKKRPNQESVEEGEDPVGLSREGYKQVHPGKYVLDHGDGYHYSEKIFSEDGSSTTVIKDLMTGKPREEKSND